jgi:hypothetical protein
MIYAGGWPAVVFDLGGARQVSAALSIPYSETTKNQQALSAPYGIAARFANAAPIHLPWAQRLERGLSLPWSVPVVRQATVVMPWQAAVVSRAAAGLPWVDRSPVSRTLSAVWASGRDVAQRAAVLPWGESMPAWRSLDAEPTLMLGGSTIKLTSARISADEGSPYWMADLSLAIMDDYDRLPVGADVSLHLAGETYALVIDGRALNRPSLADVSPTVTARSPLCRFDAPFAGPLDVANAAPVLASEQVAALIGPVDWRLLDWTIPAGRLAFVGSTSLAVARSIVEAVGGLIESRPDGSVVCRPRHAVRPCSDGFDLAISDANVFSSGERIASNSTFNALVVGDGQEAGGALDVIEFVADEADPRRGVIRARPVPWRPVDLVHTGAGVSISGGQQIEFETEEVVEVIAGKAQSKYAVDRMISADWRYANLGAVKAIGKEITAAVPAYSLLAMRYATRVYAWDVAHETPEDVQFLLMG